MEKRPKCPNCGGYITHHVASSLLPEHVRCENCGWMKERVAVVMPQVPAADTFTGFKAFGTCLCGKRSRVDLRKSGGLCGRCFSQQVCWENGLRSTPAPYLGSAAEGYRINPARHEYLANFARRKELSARLAELRKTRRSAA